MGELNSRGCLGRVGIWSLELRFWDPAEAGEAVVELEKLGYATLWIPGGIDNKVLGDVGRLLGITSRMTIATGILNIWKHEPREIADWWKSLPPDGQRRAMLGLGVSHGPIIGDAWKKPLAVTRGFVEETLDCGVPAARLCLAALGPKMLELARDYTAGAHPYLVTPEHTAMAREILGDDKLLAPEQGVILETDPGKAREIAREALEMYRNLPNYQNSWRRLGFAEEDIANVSDRLVDALFAWGSVEQVAKRVRAHLDAGADHVCIQAITGTEPGDFGPVREAWRCLAAELI